MSATDDEREALIKRFDFLRESSVCSPTTRGLLDDAESLLRHDHGLAQAAAETAAFSRDRHAESFKQGHRTGWWQAVEYVLTLQTMWDELTEGDAILELRKGRGSIYYPLFKEDPRIWADCPQDGRVTTGVEGYCDTCGFDWMR